MMKKIITQALICTLLIGSMSARAQDGLFISEIADPADEYTGRFIELFNSGSETVDFETNVFYLTRQSNGGATWGEVQLTGSIASGATYVIGGSSFESFYGFAPDLLTGILTGNGDDPYSLYDGGGHTTGTLHDIFGAVDTDGTGEAWEYTDSRAVRSPDVVEPGILWSASEWEITPANISDCDPGTHNGSVPQDPGPEPGDFALQVASDTIGAGQPVELAVYVSELLIEDDIISYQFDLDYDPSVLQYTGSSLAGTFADGGTIAENEAVPGTVSISYMNTAALSGAGDLLILQFTSLMMASTNLSLSNAFLNNIPVVDLRDGFVQVAETDPPSAAITYGSDEHRLADMLVITATFSEPMDVANPVMMSLSGAAILNNAEMLRQSDTIYTLHYSIPNTSGNVHISLSNGTDIWGNKVIPLPVSGESFTIIGLRPGDVNDDGEIQAFDAALTLQHSVGLDPLPETDALPWENWRDSTANVNRDGAITAYDAGLILQYSAGIISDFSGGKKKSSPLADISIQVEEHHIILYSHGELIGLNIEAEDSEQVLGKPRVLLQNYASNSSSGFMSADNTNTLEYKFGLCASNSPGDGTALLEIPVKNKGAVVLDLIINDRQKSIPLEFITGIHDLQQSHISVYPNPAEERLYVNGLAGHAVARIYDIRGSIKETEKIIRSDHSMDVSALESGLYFLQIFYEGGSCVRKITIK